MEQSLTPSSERALEILELAKRACEEFVGLAPFLRLNLAGSNLRPISQWLLEEALGNQGNANLLMNLSTVLYSLQENAFAESIQQQALGLQRTYILKPSNKAARVRLLMLMTPGNLGDNMPLDCLLEASPVELIYHYMSSDKPLPDPLPEHDAVMIAFSDSLANRPLLDRLAVLLQGWNQPVLNLPHNMKKTERQQASELLQGVPGLLMPSTHNVSRAQLKAVALGETSTDRLFSGCDFPMIVRPINSHGGHGLQRIMNSEALEGYLNEVSDDHYYVSPFIDYSSSDGQFRKFRVVLVNGLPYASHMAISSNWMVHYLNAGMYEDAAKRAEEQDFMEQFSRFAERHASALHTIHDRSGLDYLCVDCAEMPDGQLLIFEMDPLMVVHAMDPTDLFPYKQRHMAKVRRGFEDYLYQLVQS